MKIKIKIVLAALILLLTLSLFGCKGKPASDGSGSDSGQSSSSDSGSSDSTGSDAKDNEKAADSDTDNSAGTDYAGLSLDEKVEKKLSEMTLEEKVSQLFVVTPESITAFNPVTQAGEATRAALDHYPVGGIIYMGQNLVDTAQTKEMLANSQAYSMDRIGLPLFLCVDEEGGEVARIANNPSFTQAPVTKKIIDIGKTGDIEEARALGSQIGTYLADLGFNVDFAPVTDVITNPNNKVVANRSFGSDPALVSDMGIAFAQGLWEHKVYATFKHFPGHGATAEDTHDGYAYTNKTLDELRQAELIPFRDAIDSGTKFIMIAHISLPSVIGDNTPASLSSYIMKDLLRDEMGFQGIIITDALNMGAIANNYGTEAAVVKTFAAGADLALLYGNMGSCHQAVMNAIKNGELSEEQVNDSVRRILRVKFQMMDN